jgi:hypothetical protein
MAENGNKTPKVAKVVKEQSLVIPEFLAEPMSLAEVFVKSGCFPDIKSQAQGVVKILAGREYGLTPIQAITELYMVNGKVAMSAKLIAAAIKKSEKYDYHVNIHTAEECTISFYEIIKEEKQEIGKFTFTIKDAARAGVVNKDVWKNYPGQMLYARAISMGGRMFCADVITAYTPEEAEDIKIEPATSIVTISAEGEVKNGDTETAVS